MAALTSHPRYSTDPKPHLAGVFPLRKDEVSSVETTLKTWERTLTCIRAQLSDAERKFSSSKDIKCDLDAYDDYKDLHETITSIVKAIKTTISCTYTILLAKDSCGEIQTIARYTDKIRHVVTVTEMLSAPWNVRWRTSLVDLPLPVRGGGVLVLYSLFLRALKNGHKQLCLASTFSARGFYEKLGMERTGIFSFVFEIDSKEHWGRMQTAFDRALGPSFHVTVVLATS